MFCGQCEYVATGSYECQVGEPFKQEQQYMHFAKTCDMLRSSVGMHAMWSMRLHLDECEKSFVDAMASAKLGRLHELESKYTAAQLHFSQAVAFLDNETDIMLLRRTYTDIALRCRDAIETAVTREGRAGFKRQHAMADKASLAVEGIAICNNIIEQPDASERSRERCKETISMAEKVVGGNFKQAVELGKNAYQLAKMDRFSESVLYCQAALDAMGSLSGPEADLIRDDMRALYAYNLELERAAK